MITPRWYQAESSDVGSQWLICKTSTGGILIVIPTGGGKSLVIALMVQKLDGPALVLQPSREILRQNYLKLVAYGFRPAIFSASLGKKQISGAVTLATIGSIFNKPELFDHVRYVIIDEAHMIKPEAGMYRKFFDALQHRNIKLCGLTATPYRLTATNEGPMLKFLTRIPPKIFSEVAYYVQNGRLFEEGYLAKLQYHEIQGFDRSKLQTNSTGADYTDASVKQLLEQSGFAERLERVVRQLIALGRRGILVFTRFVAESQHLARRIPGTAVVSAETPSFERDRILREFKAGKIKVIANASVLVCGFDYPELDTVVLASPTMSLARFYQQVGRVIRPHPSKEFAMVIDMVGLVEQFGKVEDLRIERSSKSLYYVASNGKQLTNVLFGTARR